MNQSTDVLKGILGRFFNTSFYATGINDLRAALQKDEFYKTNWPAITDLINRRALPQGMPLDLIHNSANLSLDENSDEEAYKWLDLLLLNAASSDAIIEY